MPQLRNLLRVSYPPIRLETHAQLPRHQPVSLARGAGFAGFLSGLTPTTLWLGVAEAVLIGAFYGLFGGVVGSTWRKDEAN